MYLLDTVFDFNENISIWRIVPVGAVTIGASDMQDKNALFEDTRQGVKIKYSSCNAGENLSKDPLCSVQLHLNDIRFDNSFNSLIDYEWVANLVTIKSSSDLCEWETACPKSDCFRFAIDKRRKASVTRNYTGETSTRDTREKMWPIINFKWNGTELISWWGVWVILYMGYTIYEHRRSSEENIEDENRDILRRSLFSWTLGFGLVRLYQHESGLWHRKSHISFYVIIQHIRLEKWKTGLVCKFDLAGHCFLYWNIFI